MLIHYPITGERKRRTAMRLIDSVYYLSEAVADVRMGETGLEIKYIGEDGEAFGGELKRFMDGSMQTRFAAQEIVRDNRAAWSGPARLNGGGAALADDLRAEERPVLLEAVFDRLFREMAQKHGARLRKYPSIFTARQMKHSGYLHHFPQTLYGVSEIPHEHGKLQQYRCDFREGREIAGHFAHNGLFLQPCVCFHVYDEFARTGRKVKGLELITAAGPCYRHEHRSRLSDTRLREFAMREIVCIGEAEQVIRMRLQLMEETWALFRELGLRGYVENATDPFYYEEDQAMMYLQTSHEMKYELRFALDDRADFSIASFNLCSHVLCQAFGVQSEAGEAHSGCVGFGIDRWIRAFLAVHGSRAEQWPQKVTDLLKREDAIPSKVEF